MKIDTKKIFLIAGPCSAESEQICFQVAEKLAEIKERYDVQIIFKASFDKANRSSVDSYRGPGLEKGLNILKKVKETFKLPLVTDIHEVSEIQEVAKIVDIVQIPAFLCRQTSLLEAAAKTTLWVNVKKGQFMAPWDVKNIANKIKFYKNNKILITERGTTFGYNNLVVDYRGMLIMMEKGYNVVFDATHSIQTPSSQGSSSGGNRLYAPPLAYAAAAIGVKGFFFETHPDPDHALCDGPNSIFLDNLENVVKKLIAISLES